MRKYQVIKDCYFNHRLNLTGEIVTYEGKPPKHFQLIKDDPLPGNIIKPKQLPPEGEGDKE